MLKISQLRAADTAELHIKDESGEPMYFRVATPGGEEKQPVIFTIYGPGSEPYRKAQLAAQRRVMHLAKKGRRALEERTPEERANDTAEMLTELTVAAAGLDTEGLPLSQALHQLYADSKCGYIADQVNSFAADWANFSKRAPQN